MADRLLIKVPIYIMYSVALLCFQPKTFEVLERRANRNTGEGGQAFTMLSPVWTS